MHLFFAHYISALHVFSPSVSLHAIITLFFIWNVLSLFTFNVKLKNIEFSFINQLVSVWNLWQLIIKCKLNLNHSSGSVHGRREWRPIENGNFRRFFFSLVFQEKKMEMKMKAKPFISIYSWKFEACEYTVWVWGHSEWGEIPQYIRHEYDWLTIDTCDLH